MVPRYWRGFHWQALQPVIKCGEEWLPVFCAGVFLSFAAHLVLITGPNLLSMHVLVSAGRDFDHDRRRLLRVVVQTAGPQARTAANR